MARNKYGGINDMETGWTKKPINKKIYTLWFDMLRRCYDSKQQQRTRGQSYKNCSVCDRWFYLSNFYEDIKKLTGYSEWAKNGKMSIDKDLFSRGEKEYGPKTCCFIPMSVNISEMGRRTVENVRKLHEYNKIKYVLSKENECIKFDSEKEACEAMGVHQCSISSCYRRGSKCKGYKIAKMDGGKEKMSEWISVKDRPPEEG